MKTIACVASLIILNLSLIIIGCPLPVDNYVDDEHDDFVQGTCPSNLTIADPLVMRNVSNCPVETYDVD